MDIERIREIVVWRDNMMEAYRAGEGEEEEVWIYHKGELCYHRKGKQVYKDNLDYYALYITKEYFPWLLGEEYRR